MIKLNKIHFIILYCHYIIYKPQFCGEVNDLKDGLFKRLHDIHNHECFLYVANEMSNFYPPLNVLAGDW